MCSGQLLDFLDMSLLETPLLSQHHIIVSPLFPHNDQKKKIAKIMVSTKSGVTINI